MSVLQRVYQNIVQRVSLPWRAFNHVHSKIDRIEGLLVPGQERYLFFSSWNLKDGSNIVEIGSYKGRSTASLAFACVGTRKRVFAIDTFHGNDSDFTLSSRPSSWGKDGYMSEFMKNMNDAGLIQYVIPLVGKSCDVAKMWAVPIDLLFIDGVHEYSGVLADFEAFYPWVVKGGVVMFHDVLPEWPGPFKVWNEHAKPLLNNIGNWSTIAYGTKP